MGRAPAGNGTFASTHAEMGGIMRSSLSLVVFLVGLGLCGPADAQGVASGSACSNNRLVRTIAMVDPNLSQLSRLLADESSDNPLRRALMDALGETRREVIDIINRVEEDELRREIAGIVRCWLADPHVLLALVGRDISLPDIVNDIATRAARDNSGSLRTIVREVLVDRGTLEFVALVGRLDADFERSLEGLPRTRTELGVQIRRWGPRAGAHVCSERCLAAADAEQLVLTALMLSRGVSQSWDRVRDAAFRAITSESHRDLFANENDNRFYRWLYEDLEPEDVEAMVRILEEVVDRRSAAGGTLNAVLDNVLEDERMGREVSEKVLELMTPDLAR